MALDVHIAPQFRSQLDEGWVRRVAEAALAAEGVSSPVELSLVIADEGTVRELNRDYLGRDEPTDVLAFPLGEGGGDFVGPPDGALHLGEVIVSYPQAARQAREWGQPAWRELALLIVHGVLHLLGYDHDEPAPGLRMSARQEAILGRVEAWPR